MANEIKTAFNIFELQDFKFDFLREEIFENLKNEETHDFIKIFSILSLDNLNNELEAEILFSHLTNRPTPIREVVALKLEEIYDEKILSSFIEEQFLKAIIDINPNVCRSICSIISRCEKLKEQLFLKILNKIQILLEEINENDEALGNFYDNAKKIRKNHAKNKKLFSLYWYLEAFSICFDGKNNSEVLEILYKTIKFNDYTIREKTAKIIAMLENSSNELLQIAKSDENFYVKNLVYDKLYFED